MSQCINSNNLLLCWLIKRNMINYKDKIIHFELDMADEYTLHTSYKMKNQRKII